jgi:hypothetical protein
MIAFARDESGATAIEYGLIAALVSIAAIVAMGAVADRSPFGSAAPTKSGPNRAFGPFVFSGRLKKLS